MITKSRTRRGRSARFTVESLEERSLLSTLPMTFAAAHVAQSQGAPDRHPIAWEWGSEFLDGPLER